MFAGIFCITTAVHAVGFSWQVIGNSLFSGATVHRAPIVLSPTGTPYVAYRDAVNSSGANVMSYTGSAWVTVGEANFSAGEIRDISLAITANGTPYVAYVDVASSSRATVKTYDGSAWVTVGNQGFSTSSIQETVLGFSPTGTPYVAFVDVVNNNAVNVMRLEGSTWVTVGSAYTAARAGGLSFVFSPTGTPYVAFSDVSSGNPTVISFNGTSWNQVGSTIPVNLSANAPIAISSTGTLYLATTDVSNEFSQMYIFDGSDWAELGDEFATSTNGELSIAVSANGTPYVAMVGLTSFQGSVIFYDGSRWVTTGDALFTSTTIGFLSLAVNSTGTPYIAYSDASLSSYMMTVMAFLPNLPSQVVNVTAHANSISEITLSWDTPLDDGGVSITGYVVERESVLEGGFVTIVANTGSAGTTYTDTGLRPSRVYRYRISALNSVGTGTVSDAVRVTTRSNGGQVLVLVTPTALQGSGMGPRALSFIINNGEKITGDPVVTLHLNANPQTVRGYAVSLDPTFQGTSILELNQVTPPSFTLPNIPGRTFTVYLKYYSVTGIYSSLLSQTITYEPQASITENNLPVHQKTSVLFKRTLQIGSVGSDVRALQVFLNTHGFEIAESGVGSPGRETDFYGKLTASAVSKFQEAHAQRILVPNNLLQGNGVFGPATRATVNALMQ
jgi:hypothetical protein